VPLGRIKPIINAKSFLGEKQGISPGMIRKSFFFCLNVIFYEPGKRNEESLALRKYPRDPAAGDFLIHFNSILNQRCSESLDGGAFCHRLNL